MTKKIWRVFPRPIMWLNCSIFNEVVQYCCYFLQDLGRLQELQFLELSENKLEVLPPELGNLSELRDFFVSDNLLLELPETIGNF